MFTTITSSISRTLLWQCKTATYMAFRSSSRPFTSSPRRAQEHANINTQQPNTYGNMLVNIAQVNNPTQTAEEIWLMKSKEAMTSLSQNPPANAYTGRSVKVVAGNVAEAYARLHLILQRNQVRMQLKRAERHEKKGEKRRRLSSERWRRQFAHEVRKKVQLVTKIRNRGA